jgi:hypothetical protein
MKRHPLPTCASAQSARARSRAYWHRFRHISLKYIDIFRSELTGQVELARAEKAQGGA